MRRLTAGLAAFGMLWGLAGCAGPPRQAAPPAGQAATAGAARPGATVKQRDHHLSGRHLDLAVYYPRTFRGRRYLAPEWHPVPYTRAVAAAAVGELLGGQPLCPGSRRPFPERARLRGVSVEGGTATVDLSGSALRVPAGRAERWPLQALVHTLTQFPTVRRVLVRVEGRAVGKPLARDPALPLAPIALAEPTPGAQVKGHRLVVKGEASVYEGTVGLRLRDDRGKVMAQSYATAARGAPGRGPFSGALSFTAPATSRPWTLDAFEVSPEDGEITYAVTVPVWVGR
jgi:hypothetical protein